ncbi:MAG: hypothetical protein L0287_22310, partial [Anaerolineae bacterium]|nr:hypothetical protein [Anaerolineae bacterium]
DDRYGIHHPKRGNTGDQVEGDEDHPAADHGDDQVNDFRERPGDPNGRGGGKDQDQTDDQIPNPVVAETVGEQVE